MGESDEVGKIFIGGLTRDTTDDMLKNYFLKYGDILECIVMKDKATGNSRGFGFVKYADPNSVAGVLKDRPHSLDNKVIDPKPCTPKGIQQQKKNAAMEHTQTHKIFIGGIAQNCSEDEVKTYFARYGVVTEVVFVINKEDNRHKGFGFVTFEDESSVDQAVDAHFHDIGGKRVEAKRATPREKMNPNRQQGHDSGEGYGSYGYGYGGQGQGGWMPPQGGPNGMMGYGGYGYQGYGTTYPQGYTQSYYGYNYPSMPYGGMGQQSNSKGDGSKGGGAYGGMGNYGQQSSHFGPTRGGNQQSYGNDYGNGYGRNGSDGGGSSRGGGGYHPYKR